MTDQILSRPGADIHYDIAGEGPLVVSLHGLSASRVGDTEMGLSTAALADRGRRVVRYDARGHGASTGRPQPADYRWSALADDLIALLDEVGDGTPVDATGASMGTGTLLHAVTAHPDRFRRLVLFIPPTAWESRAAQGAVYESGAQLVEKGGLDAWNDLVATMTPPPVIAERGVTILPKVSAELFSSVLRGAAMTDLPDREAIAGIRQPTLILAWVGDPVHPVATAEQLAELIPGSRLEIAEHAADADRWLDLAAEHLAG
ncbi:MAG TPA: alpha/beta fold hydrolase [Pseudolysinimonas sp.]|nr:alpha/beta fold hydrolase [Pseudolysinimonas sp.]